MHIESKNDDFLMYTLNGGKPVPPSTTVLGDMDAKHVTKLLPMEAYRHNTKQDMI